MFHWCSLVFIGVPLVFIGVHWCSLVFHWCSLVFHWCSLVFIGVPLVWCFRLDPLGGYAIPPHFRNFSALFPQIRRQKLAISAILYGYEQRLPTSYKTQHKPFSFHFARDRSDSSILQSSWVIISREKLCCCCCYCGCCLQIFVICIVFVCFSAFK